MVRLIARFLFTVSLCSLISCSEDQFRSKPISVGRSVTVTGLASFYSDALQGRKTASGEHYNREAFTAAHRAFPFGTLVRIVNQRNGKSIVVRINDRGPYVDGRIIDLSWRAAHSLDMIADGVVPVLLELIAPTR